MRKIDIFFDRLQGWYDRLNREDKASVCANITFAFLVLMTIALLLCSCKHQQPIVSSQTSQQTLISERYDSAHSVAGDSATAALLFRCDSLGNVYLATLQTEQGKRLRLELLLTSTQYSLDSAKTAGKVLGALSPMSNPTADKSTNQPLFVKIDCKEDSFEVVIRGLRERVAYYEKNDTKQEVPVRYVPTYYTNMEKGFWTLFAIIVITLALLCWKNWGKIAAWVIKLYVRIKL